MAKAGKQKSDKAPEPGTFLPDLPADAQELLRTFAIAARAVLAKPGELGEVSQKLGTLVGKAAGPLRTAGEEAARLWSLFARVAQKAKPALLEEGAKALYRDLEGIAQKLDLPPLDRFMDLPSSLVARLTGSDKDEAKGGTASAEDARREVKALGARAKPDAVLALFAGVAEPERQQIYKSAIGAGRIGRSDAALIEQALATGRKPGGDDDLLTQALIALAESLRT